METYKGLPIPAGYIQHDEKDFRVGLLYSNDRTRWKVWKNTWYSDDDCWYGYQEHGGQSFKTYEEAYNYAFGLEDVAKGHVEPKQPIPATTPHTQPNMNIDLSPFVGASLEGLTISADNPLIQGALADAEANRQAAAREQLAVTLGTALGNHSSRISSHRTQIRCHRRSIKEYTQSMNQLDRAKAYFEQTGNPVPWFIATGTIPSYWTRNCGVTEEEFSQLSTVPDDWAPAE
jgi:hypothetical protein